MTSTDKQGYISIISNVGIKTMTSYSQQQVQHLQAIESYNKGYDRGNGSSEAVCIIYVAWSDLFQDMFYVSWIFK